MNKYIQYSKILYQIAVEKGNFKTVLFREFKGDSKLKEAYGILIKAVKNYDKIVAIGESINKKSKRNVIGNLQLFCILIIEQFYSNKKKIEGGGKLKKVIIENKEFIASCLNLDENADHSGLIRQNIHIRWIDRNQLPVLGSTHNPSDHPFISKATPDEHVKNLFTLSYLDYQSAIKKDATIMDSSEFIVQSKSSSMPVFLLFKNIIGDNQTNFDLIDCCSAPGNKTMQAAEYIKGRGKVYAFEKNLQRYQLLEERVQKYGFNDAIQCKNADFLTVDVNEYPNAQYFVADPSCSGTGMLNHIYFDEDQIKLEEENRKLTNKNQTFQERTEQIFKSYDKKMQERVVSLSQFQLRILNKLSTFPNIKAFSYSTCSIHSQENEDVVAKFLEQNPTFQLINACPEWKTRGFRSENLPQASFCVRVNPFENKSDGFFVALFQKK